MGKLEVLFHKSYYIKCAEVMEASFLILQTETLSRAI